MNLIKFPKVTGDEFILDTAIVLDASRLAECNVTGTDCIATFDVGETNSILTFTFDGATAGAKLKSATAMQTLLIETCQTLAGPTGTSRGIFDFVPEAKTAAGMIAFEARVGLVIDATAVAGEGLVTIALS